MPTIAEFFGISIMLYFDDHFPAHFHAEYQGKEALIRIKDGKVISGKFPPKVLKLIEDWRRIHVAELLKQWENVKNFIPPKPIKPLDK
ncbi:MAG: DUF4160 domain-containing protein [Alphaproteobacteria bacterium]|nr:DUF4160 domain-containing protein [Alphaproteobacteria bacterium]